LNKTGRLGGCVQCWLHPGGWLTWAVERHPSQRWDRLAGGQLCRWPSAVRRRPASGAVAGAVGDVAHGDEDGGAQRLGAIACDGDVDRGDGESGAGAQGAGGGRPGLGEELGGDAGEIGQGGDRVGLEGAGGVGVLGSPSQLGRGASVGECGEGEAEGGGDGRRSTASAMSWWKPFSLVVMGRPFGRWWRRRRWRRGPVGRSR